MNPKVIITIASLIIIISVTINFIQKKNNDKLRKQIAFFHIQISDLEDEKSVLEGRVTELEEVRDNLQANIEEMKDNLDELKDQMDGSFFDKLETESKIRDLEEKVEEMESNNN